MAPRRRLSVAVAVLVSLTMLAACGADSGDSAGQQSAGSAAAEVVVTTSVLGAVVSQLVEDDARVTVIIPNGVDPHDFRPSAKDRVTIDDADLLVANGLGLESSLDEIIEDARAQGTPLFVAGDHIDVRTFGPDEMSEDEHADEVSEDDHADENAVDPHFWVDPVAMKDVVAALADELTTTASLELGDAITTRRADVDAELDDVNDRVGQTLAVVAPERRVLVTGHESMGYFARRYDFTLVGAVIPSSTSQAAPSAGSLATLKDQIDQYDVPAIFDELGTPAAVVDAIASETGVRVVELGTHTVPDDGSYASFMLQLANGVTLGLGPQ